MAIADAPVCTGSNHVPGCSHFTTAALDPTAAEPYLAEVLVDLVDIGTNVRSDVGDLDELKASIEELGILEPIVVTAQDDGFRLVVGQRRLTAARELGLEKIPAIVRPAGDVDEPGARRSIEQLAENLIRKELNPIEEAKALREVLDADPELTQAELARRLGVSAPWVSNSLRLLQLDEKVQDQVRAGELSASHAKVLVVLPPQEQRDMARTASRVSSHELERQVGWRQDAIKQRERAKARAEKAGPKALAALEAAGVEAGTAIYIHAYSIDTGPVEKALKAAGYTTTRDYPYDRGPASKCDCKVVKLELNRSWSVKPACTNERHLDRQRNADHLVRKAEREALERRMHVLREALERELRATAIPYPAIRLLWRATSGYYYGDEPTDLYAALAANVVAEHRFRDVDIAALLEELGLQDPEKAIEAPAPAVELAGDTDAVVEESPAKPKRSRKAKAEPAAEISTEEILEEIDAHRAEKKTKASSSSTSTSLEGVSPAAMAAALAEQAAR